MDRKTVIGLIICVILLFLTPSIVNWIYPPIEVPEEQNLGETNLVATNAGKVSSTGVVSSIPSSAAQQASTNRSASETQAWSLQPLPEAKAPKLSWSVWDTLMKITGYGGGIQEIELTNYPAQISCTKNRMETNQTRYVTLNRGAPLPVLTLLAGQVLPADLLYEVKQQGKAVVLRSSPTNGLVVEKRLEPTTNHMIRAVIRIQNVSTQTVSLPDQQIIIGTAMPAANPRDMRFLGLQWYDGRKARFVSEGWFANRTLGCLPGTPREVFFSPGISNVVWAAVQSRFFTIIAREPQPAPHVMARRIPVSPPAGATSSRPYYAYVGAFVHPQTTLPPEGSIQYELGLYAGPKEYKTLAALGREEDRAMNFTSFFGWFARALLLSMNGLHSLGLSYGLTIIAITIIIKLLFWPLTAASTRSMKRMAALQPKMKEIQEKYKDDPKKMNEKLMQFMRENRVNPLGGCLPILLQIPVFIGFYQMLQSAIELRGARFLWICDLSQPDTVAYILGFPINPLPLIMGVTQFWQARMTPVSPGTDPVQQKMMQYMPLIFVLILYNFPSGLALYWTVQNLLSILQTKLTRTTEPPNSAGAAACPTGTCPFQPKTARGSTKSRKRK